MLVIARKRNQYFMINNGDYLVQVMGVSKKNLRLKVYLKDNQDNSYTFEGNYYINRDKPFHITNTLKVHYLRGIKKFFKIGFEGQDVITRCEGETKFTIKRPRNLDDDFFNFDTEGY